MTINLDPDQVNIFEEALCLNNVNINSDGDNDDDDDKKKNIKNDLTVFMIMMMMMLMMERRWRVVITLISTVLDNFLFGF